MQAPLSFMWIFGNLSVYMNSFFHFKCYPECLDADIQWILSLYVAGQLPGLFLAKPLIKVFGIRWTGVFAMVVNNAVVLSSAWTLQYSVAWTAVMYGLLMGPTVGIGNIVVVHVVNGWATEWAAILLASSSSFATMLAVVQNQVITAFINRENLEADTKLGPNMYFSQPQILEHVPGAVMVIAAMNFGIQLVGYILISNPPTDAQNNSADNFSERTADDISGDTQPLQTPHSKRRAFGHDVKMYGGDDVASGTTSNRPQPITIERDSEGAKKEANSQTGRMKISAAAKDTPISWKPSEMLLSPAFYAVALFGMAIEFGLLLKSNYYKDFAQLYIHDDRYLTLVGTLIPVTSTCSRVLSGAMVDKGFLTLKDVSVFGLSLNCVLCAFWYLVPQVDAILYMFLALGLAVAQSQFYVVISCASLRLYGPDHLTINYGLVQVSVFLSSFIILFAANPIIHGLGWFWLFAFCGIFSLLILCLTIFTDFDTQQQKTKCFA